ncbi:MAG: DUF4625 domain-containing protein [Bacteroides sp.]|nr:DUF4625 domain-containing protein [Bacteroides sp.]
MKTIKTILLLSVLFTVTLFVACEDEKGDTTRPEIQIISPEEDAELIIGGVIGFKATFTDNEGLASYRIDIHYPSDGHTHSVRSDEPDQKDDRETFSFEGNWDLPNEPRATVEYAIEIPEDVKPGEYHLVVYCYDVSSNQAVVARDIILAEAE